MSEVKGLSEGSVSSTLYLCSHSGSYQASKKSRTRVGHRQRTKAGLRSFR